jgi:hypothetical protein
VFLQLRVPVGGMEGGAGELGQPFFDLVDEERTVLENGGNLGEY